VRHYFDASVLVALFVEDDFTQCAVAFVGTGRLVAVVSDFAKAEFASAISRRVRMGELDTDRALKMFTALDTWSGEGAELIETSSADIVLAEKFLRRLDLTLRTPDAINIAIASRLGAPLLTFDGKMADAADALGVSVTPI